MASSPTRASPAGHGEAAGHLRNVLGALAVATTDLLTEAVPGGWGLGGHANTNDELVAAARKQIAQLQAKAGGPAS